MRIADSLIMELEKEAQTTRKFLEAMPANQMSYKPHEKSMPAGRLAMHVASLLGVLVDWGMQDLFDMGTMETGFLDQQHTKEQILEAHDKSIAKVKEVLGKVDDQKLMAPWKMAMNGKQVMEMPRIGFFRFWMFNHLLHHRGQFGVYLRLMGAKVPASYGPSADENPMAELMAAAAGKA